MNYHIYYKSAVQSVGTNPIAIAQYMHQQGYSLNDIACCILSSPAIYEQVVRLQKAELQEELAYYVTGVFDQAEVSGNVDYGYVQRQMGIS